MPDANYAVAVSGNINTSNVDSRRTARVTHYYTSGCKLVYGLTSEDTSEDFEFANLAVFR